MKDICPAKMGCVQAKIDLTGQLDRLRPGNYFKPCRHCPYLIDFFSPSLSLYFYLFSGYWSTDYSLPVGTCPLCGLFFNSVGVGDICALTTALTCSTVTGFFFAAFQADVYN